jgi:hypothetical protein
VCVCACLCARLLNSFVTCVDREGVTVGYSGRARRKSSLFDFDIISLSLSRDGAVNVNDIPWSTLSRSWWRCLHCARLSSLMRSSAKNELPSIPAINFSNSRSLLYFYIFANFIFHPLSIVVVVVNKRCVNSARGCVRRMGSKIELQTDKQLDAEKKYSMRCSRKEVTTMNSVHHR